MVAPVERTGTKVGLLSVLCRAPNTLAGRTQWICTCECGAEIIQSNNQLRDALLAGCTGCRAKYEKPRGLKHGKSNTKVYNTWRGLWARTANPKHKSYAVYRDHYVDPSWLKFEKFYEDMGDPPTNFHSLERVNNKEGYFKDNCCWATATEQARNRRNTLFVTYNNETLCLASMCEKYGLKYQRTYDRIKKGWSFEKAFISDKPFTIVQHP